MELANIKNSIEIVIRIRNKNCLTLTEKDALADLVNFVEEIIEKK